MTATISPWVSSVRSGIVTLVFADVVWATGYVVVNNLLLHTSDFGRFGEIVLGLLQMFLNGLLIPLFALRILDGWYFSLYAFVALVVVVSGLAVIILDGLRRAAKRVHFQGWFVAFLLILLGAGLAQLLRVFREPIEPNLKLAIAAFVVQVIILAAGLAIRYRDNLFFHSK